MFIIRRSLPPLPHSLQSYALRRDSSAVTALRNKFKDPSSPFYLAPGETGPSDAEFPFPADDAALKAAAFQKERVSHRQKAEQHALSHGFDPLSFWEQKICWGDLDSFRHLNNVRYVRFIESGRMKYFEELAKSLDPERARKMLEGRGKSIILKSISVNFKHPVVYPDTLLISHKAHALQSTRFHLTIAMYSHAQQAVVATSEAVCVWYDYDTLKKCDAPKDLNAILHERVELGEATKQSMQ
ncbi:hypothetical protein FRB94_002817 [Tulasnella sp. JGI-2019a]|nr:hypothetical protein FRB94_002817 [Tulasnella sp. JGI-2019a]KAG9031865.1 hypothetical protein FRB95_002138 [Tulasnella sp. JGI-2019a]